MDVKYNLPRVKSGTSFEDLGYSIFDETETYAAGDVVIYGGSLYRFTAAHTGVWTGDDAEATSIEELIKDGGGGNGRSPYIGQNGNWYEWDDTTQQFVDTGTKAQGKDGAQGPQGNTGSSVDYPFELVNNLTTDDATKALAASQGVALASELETIETTDLSSQLVYGTSNRFSSYTVGDEVTVTQTTSAVFALALVVGTDINIGDKIQVFGKGGTLDRLLAFVNDSSVLKYVAEAQIDASTDGLLFEVTENGTLYINCVNSVQTRIVKRIQTLRRLDKIEDEIEDGIDALDSKTDALDSKTDALDSKIESINDKSFDRVIEHTFQAAYSWKQISPSIPSGSIISNDSSIRIRIYNDRSGSELALIEPGESYTTSQDVNYMRSVEEAGSCRLVVKSGIISRSGIFERLNSINSRTLEYEADVVAGQDVNIRIFNELQIKEGDKFLVRVSSSGATWDTLKLRSRPISSDAVTFDEDGEKTVSFGADIPRLYLYSTSINTSGKIKIQLVLSIPSSELGKSSVIHESIANQSVGANNFDESIVDCANLVDYGKMAIGYYLTTRGFLNRNDSYNTTDFIKINETKSYRGRSWNAASEAKFLLCYDKYLNPIGELKQNVNINGANIDFEEGTEFIRVTFYASDKNQISQTNSPITTFVAYAPKIKQQLIDVNAIANTIAPVVAPEIVPLIPAKPLPFGCFSNSGTITQGQSITATYIPCWKNVTLAAEIKGALSEVLFGFGKNTYYGKWFKITDTQVTIFSGEQGTEGTTYTHGIILTSLTFITLSSKDDISDPTTRTLKIMNDLGDVWSQDINIGTSVGTPFIGSEQDSSLDVSLKYQLEDILQKVWLFGDSYFSYSQNRWIYYLLTWGHTANLLNAQGGEAAPQAFGEFQSLISTGARPSVAVWCEGANGGIDETSGPNSNWLGATEDFLDACDTYGIIPILATIPTTPERVHDKLNEWVRNSGRRYIDFAAAVESTVEGDKYWKGWGTDHALLSSDMVHPTSYGAKVLAAKAIADAPEITLNA